MNFCGEISYDSPIGGVHSDICWGCNPGNTNNPISDEHREFLHGCLDEWLNKSNGTGAFWVGDSDYFKNWNEAWYAKTTTNTMSHLWKSCHLPMVRRYPRRLRINKSGICMWYLYHRILWISIRHNGISSCHLWRVSRNINPTPASHIHQRTPPTVSQSPTS